MENNYPSTPTPINDFDLDETDFMRIDIKRRSLPATSYGNELIREDALTSKQANFVTDRPTLWYHAVKSHITKNDVMNRCTIKSRKVKNTHKISILKIWMTNDNNQKVNFDINFHTGVVSIKCSDCPKWIESQFPKIKLLLENPGDIVEEDTPPPISDPPTPGRVPKAPSEEEGAESTTQELGLLQPNSTPPPPPAPPLPPHAPIPPSTSSFPPSLSSSSSKDQKDEIKKQRTEIEELWKSIEQIKNAVNNLDRSVNDAVSKIDEARQERSKNLSDLDLKISRVELSLDAKVSLFFEETEKSILQKYSNTEKNLSNKIWNFKNELKKRQEEVQSQLRHLRYNIK